MEQSNTGAGVTREDFVPDLLSEIERREFDVVLTHAGFTPEMKRKILHSPHTAIAMYHAAVSALSLPTEREESHTEHNGSCRVSPV